MKNVVLGVTGSIAAVKAPALVRLFKEAGYHVSCLLSDSAEKFVTPLSLATLSGQPVYSRMFGPEASRMPHLQLAREAHLFVIAPASAVVLGRCAHGISEDLVSLTYLTTTAPVMMAPAMHDTMWDHPATQANVKLLKKRGVQFVGPTQGKLADSNEGVGRMSEPEEILKAVQLILDTKLEP